MSPNEEIRRYWDQRALEADGGPTATTDDVFLRTLELDVLSAAIDAVGPSIRSIGDFGCGDGRTLLELALRHPEVEFVGVDFSSAMIAAAERARDGSAEAPRVRFVVGDVTRLEDVLGDEQFDVVMTDRCLINLATAEDQEAALGSIAARVRPGGTYLAVENFLDGQDRLNAARADVGLHPIPIRWHNRFLEEEVFLRQAARWFDDIHVDDFSSTYYLVTRVAYSAFCAAADVRPDYHHPLHEIATRMPPVGRFSPIRLVRMRRSTAT